MAAALRANGRVVLLKSELEYLGRVITEMEQKTSGEMRLMIVRRSGRSPLLAPVIFLSLTTVSLMVLWFERVRMLACPEWVLPAIFGGAAFVALAVSRWSRTARMFYSKLDRRIAAQTRAEVEFHRQGLTKTRDATGILIFVSLFERQAVVLADRGIVAKCPPATWDGVIATVLSGARQRRWAPKLEDALRQCGGLLAQHFPRQSDDQNELPDDVIVD